MGQALLACQVKYYSSDEYKEFHIGTAEWRNKRKEGHHSERCNLTCDAWIKCGDQDTMYKVPLILLKRAAFPRSVMSSKVS